MLVSRSFRGAGLFIAPPPMTSSRTNHRRGGSHPQPIREEEGLLTDQSEEKDDLITDQSEHRAIKIKEETCLGLVIFKHGLGHSNFGHF